MNLWIQIVEDADTIAILQKLVYKMGADKACPSRHQNTFAHFAFPFWP
jgi:hypothetical protein